MKRLAITLLFLLSLPCGMEAQGLWSRFLLWVREGNTFDSTYIYQRPAGFQVSFDASLQRALVDLQADFTTTCYDGECSVVATDVPSLATIGLSNNLNGSFGAGFAYGKLGLGFGFYSWPAEAKKSSINLNLGYQGHKWGINASLSGFQHQSTNTLTIGKEGDTWYRHTESMSANPGTVFHLAADAYWVINRQRFAYTAAYKCDMVQRHSMGSLLICARGDITGMVYEGDDRMFTATDFSSYATVYNSVGVGYSHNIVFVHRDAEDSCNMGLFNITLNLTAMPVLTYSSGIIAMPVDGSDNVTIASSVTPNAIANAALGISLGQWFFSLQYRHNFFYFRSAEKMSAADLRISNSDIDNITLNGIMQNWRLMTMAAFNF